MNLRKLAITSMALFGTLFANENTDWIHDYLTVVPDFPQKGIQFQCYPNLLQNPDAFQRVIQTFAEHYKEAGLDAIAGLDARGFVFGAALAYEMKIPFIMVRKPGKLPRKVERIDYALEYGTASFEIEVDSIKPGSKVLVIDDVMATGGTAKAASDLIERVGGNVVEVACLIELSFLKGRDKVQKPVYSLVKVD